MMADAELEAILARYRARAIRDRRMHEAFAEEGSSTAVLESEEILIEIEHLVAEVRRLRGALLVFGEHRAQCAFYGRVEEQMARNEWPTCTCGLDAELR